MNTRSAEKNRYQDSMVLSNIRLSSVTGNPFGRTMGYLTTQTARLVWKGAKQKIERILRSLEGLEISPYQLFKTKWMA